MHLYMIILILAITLTTTSFNFQKLNCFNCPFASIPHGECIFTCHPHTPCKLCKCSLNDCIFLLVDPLGGNIHIWAIAFKNYSKKKMENANKNNRIQR